MKWVDDWGRGNGAALTALAPDLVGDEMMRKMFARLERYASTPNAMRHYFEVNFQIDVLDILPAVHKPTLVLHRDDDRQVPATAGRHLAEVLPDARYVDCGSGGHLFWYGDTEQALASIRQFLTGTQKGEGPKDRILSTVLMTDIVGSTERAQKLGDGAWRDLLDRHDRIISETVALHRGRYIKNTGDGGLAIFDGPGRAVECGLQLNERLEAISLNIRVGLHTGEIELRDDDIGGINVHIAARIMGLAGDGEILVSRTVADLMVGNADIKFEARGAQELKGVSGNWEIFLAHG